MATQYAPIAKDSSINTTENTPRNIADVLAEELSAIEQAIAGGSGSGGHTIVNASGTDMTQRAKMQFVDAEVTDDAVNDVTKISTTPASYPSANVTYGSGSVEDALDAHTTAISTNTTDIGTINTKLGKFQHGTYTTEGITKNTEINVTVPFPSAFSSIPTVVVTPVCSFGYGGYLSGHLKSVTKTQFIYNIKNSSNADLTLLLEWMATNM